MKTLPGNFSDALVAVLPAEAHGGYLASLQRNKTRDRIVERALAAQGLGPRGIAVWLGSSSARHMMDSVDRRTNAGAFAAIVERCTETAFADVTVWSHPDHDGSLGGSKRIRERVKAAFPVMVTRVNAASGKSFREDIDTPYHCSPSSETYWSR